MKECPKCSAPCSDRNTECQKCGIIFTKYLQYQDKQRAKEKTMLVACVVCGRNISKNAASCPHCGDPMKDPAIKAPQLKPEETAMKTKVKKNSPLTLFFGGVIVIALLSALFSDLSSQTKRGPSAGLTNMAFIQCKDFAKGSLKAPSTADFPFLDFSSNVATDNLYIISSYVDAQNDFGAKIRTRWRCKVRYIGGDRADPNSWNLVDLQMYKN